MDYLAKANWCGVARVDVPIRPSGLFECSGRCVLMSHSNRPSLLVELCGAALMTQSKSPELLVCRPELFGVSTPSCCTVFWPWVVTDGVCLSSCTVFGPELYGFRSGFPYKPGQLSSSNKNSGKRKLSPRPLKKSQSQTHSTYYAWFGLYLWARTHIFCIYVYCHYSMCVLDCRENCCLTIFFFYPSLENFSTS
jgi:hypothetical protein